jgi:hypothetical protein
VGGVQKTSSEIQFEIEKKSCVAKEKTTIFQTNPDVLQK